MSSRQEQWAGLWKKEKTTCHEYTGHRNIMDWLGYGSAQEQRRKAAWHWINDQIERLEDGHDASDDAAVTKDRISYMQAVLDGYNHYWWTVPAYPRANATDDESCKIKERCFYASFFDDGMNDGTDAPYDDQQDRKRANYQWLEDRRQWLLDCVHGDVDGQPAGWDVKSRRQRYDNMNIAVHKGEQWDLFKQGKYVLQEDRNGGNGDTRHRLSDHFTVEEFDCNDGTQCGSREYDGLESLCKQMLEPLRAKYGSVHVNSGYRTPSYNASVGGATDSFHIYSQHDGNDQAADVTCANGSPSQWHSYLKQLRSEKRGGNGGLGLYSSFVHVDIRDYPSDWTG